MAYLRSFSFAKLIDSWNMFTIFARNSILNGWLGSKYASVKRLACSFSARVDLKILKNYFISY